MTHYDRDYSKSPAPAFDAVEDIREWLGPAYYKLIEAGIGRVTDCAQFRFYCVLAGVQGFPVRAWYESFHGEGSWKEEDKQ